MGQAFASATYLLFWLHNCSSTLKQHARRYERSLCSPGFAETGYTVQRTVEGVSVTKCIFRATCIISRRSPSFVTDHRRLRNFYRLYWATIQSRTPRAGLGSWGGCRDPLYTSKGYWGRGVHPPDSHDTISPPSPLPSSSAPFLLTGVRGYHPRESGIKDACIRLFNRFYAQIFPWNKKVNFVPRLPYSCPPRISVTHFASPGGQGAFEWPWPGDRCLFRDLNVYKVAYRSMCGSARLAVEVHNGD